MAQTVVGEPVLGKERRGAGGRLADAAERGAAEAGHADGAVDAGAEGSDGVAGFPARVLMP